MKKSNKIILLLLAFLLMIGMVGCKKVEIVEPLSDEYDKKLTEYSTPFNLYLDGEKGNDTNSGTEKTVPLRLY